MSRVGYIFVLMLLFLVEVLPGRAEVAANQKETPKAADKSSLKGLLGSGESKQSSNAPMFIKSDSLDLNSKDRIFSYRGNVEVKRDDLTITAKTIDGYYDDQNKIEKMIAKNNVVITKGESLRATSNRAVYKVNADVIELTENPEIYKEGSVLAADKVTIYVKEDRSEAEGNVRVKVLKSTTPGAAK